LDFLAANLAQDTVWTFVMAHHPIASSSDHGFNYRGGLRGLLLKPYLCTRADAYFSGHSHHLEFRQPEDCRLSLFISGGGGGELYQTIDDHETEVKFKRTAHGFLEVEISDQQMRSRFIGVDGSVLYETSKEARPVGKS
jgi:hypothetical protein